MTCPNCHRDIAEYSNFCYFCGAKQARAPGGTPVARRLMRSSTDCKLAGVCGGIAEYLDVDSTVIRLIWVLLVLFPVPLVPAILGYCVAWLVMPRAPLPGTLEHPAPAQTPTTTQSA
jgi:phage shock protein C